jgi:hypothetical protein
MKLSRKQLKELVKECLIEILSEGIGVNSISEIRKTPTTSARTSTVSSKPNISEQQLQRSTSPNLHELPSIIKNATKDPIMASILADTAKTTLVEQAQSERHGPSFNGQGADAATMAMASVEPAEIFDEATMDMWARAAFEPKKL